MMLVPYFCCLFAITFFHILKVFRAILRDDLFFSRVTFIFLFFFFQHTYVIFYRSPRYVLIRIEIGLIVNFFAASFIEWRVITYETRLGENLPIHKTVNADITNWSLGMVSSHGFDSFLYIFYFTLPRWLFVRIFSLRVRNEEEISLSCKIHNMLGIHFLRFLTF